jgi:rhodanese-related sulfurtransferase
MAVIAPADLGGRIDRGERPVVVDVRTPGEFAAGHVPGAVNVPFLDVSRLIGRVPATPSSELIVYCGHGPRAWIAARAFRRLGFRRLRYLRGHWAAWRRAGLPVETGRSIFASEGSGDDATG